MQTAPGMPADWGLYGITYDTKADLIYAVFLGNTTIYKYSSDSLLTGQGIPFRDLRTGQPTLEDVFLSLTGSKMRE